MMTKRIVNNDRARFESYISPEALTGCWIWTGALDGHDYGHFWFDHGIQKAHRVSWMLNKGPIPSGLWVLHHCDNPSCVNPDHLFVGDRTANMRDMASKCRQVFQINPEKVKRGQNSLNAKMTDDQAMNALSRIANGETGSSLAREFGVAKCTISALKTGRNWAHLHS